MSHPPTSVLGTRTAAILPVVVATFALLLAALFNGYPFVLADSTAYIEQAAYPHFAPQYTPFYGIFLRIASLRMSLWWAAMVQCALLAGLLVPFIRLLLPAGVSWQLQSLAAVVLILLCPVTLVAPTLMADVFTPILLLSVVLLLHTSSRWQVLVYAGIAYLATAMHYAHTPLLLLVATALLIYGWRQPFIRQRALLLLGVVATFWCTLAGANMLKHHGFTFARGAKIYLIGRFTEAGILSKFLADQCPTHQYTLCQYRSNMPTDMVGMLTSGESPLVKVGGWDSTAAEVSTINKAILTTPRYAGMYLQKVLIASLKQLTHIMPPAQLPAFGKGSEPYKKVASYYTDESREYVTSAQQAERLQLYVLVAIWTLIFIISTIWVIALGQSAVPAPYRSVYALVILFMLANALVVSAFATTTPRFQYRLAWLVPVLNLLLLARHYRSYLAAARTSFHTPQNHTHES